MAGTPAAGSRPGAAVVARCLRAAAAAPSVHNSQPWLFRLRDGGIDVATDPDRRLAVLDPHGRELLISVGAAVFNLRLAMCSHGRVPLLRLDPASGSGAVARIEWGPLTTPGAGVRALASAIPHRRTNRGPFASTVVPAGVLDAMHGAAVAGGAVLDVLDPVRRTALLSLTHTADARLRADPGYRRELAGWTAWWPGRVDGIPPDAAGLVDAAGVLPLRDFTLDRSGGGPRRTARFEGNPRIAVLSTAGDGPAQWLRAGMALQRVLLTATMWGVATQPMTQPLEVPQLRRAITDPASGRYAQMIIRIGYGLPAPASPRRPLP